MGAQPTIRSGEKIPFLDGTNDHLMMDRSFVNKLISVANAVLNDQSRVITDHGIINPTIPVPISKTIVPGCFYNISCTANAADTWRCFQFRDMVFGGRSKYSANGSGYGFTSGADALSDSGNGETKMLIENDLANFQGGDLFAQPVALPTQGVMPSNTDVVIYDPTISAGAGTFGQIVLDSNGDLTGNVFASFWLEIVDPPGGGYYARVVGRMFAASGVPAGRQTVAFPPVSPSIIPLCIIEANAIGHPSIIPLQTGNLTNRYPQGYKEYRGSWTGDTLANQIFFKGDQVLDDTVSVFTINDTIGQARNFYNLYEYIGTADQEATAPHADLANWKTLYALTPAV